MTAIHDEPTTRWAIIRSFADGDDLHGKRDVVSEITFRRQRDGAPPLDRLRLSKCASSYLCEQVADGVMAGMVRGAPVSQSGGFGWRDEADRVANDPRQPKKIIAGLPSRNRRRTGTSASPAP